VMATLTSATQIIAVEMFWEGTASEATFALFDPLWIGYSPIGVGFCRPIPKAFIARMATGRAQVYDLDNLSTGT